LMHMEGICRVIPAWADLLWCSCPPPIAVLLVDSIAHYPSSNYCWMEDIQPPVVGFECKDIKDHQRPTAIIPLEGFNSDYLL
jgi:hypothetical protein